jgi:hypothetical protein
MLQVTTHQATSTPGLDATRFTIHEACALARVYAKRCITAAVGLLIDAGLTLNQAARYVFAVLRAQRAGAL